ncbi:hypothetical protein GobsT_69420 [Gemmata obscuriglobus]
MIGVERSLDRDVKQDSAALRFRVSISESAVPFGCIMKFLAIPLCLLVALVGAADDKAPPAPKLPLGKDTTFVVGPLDKQGYIDYEVALHAELSKNITPENNANALLIQAFGPAPEGSELPLEYFRWLDIPVLPKDGEYLVGAQTYAVKQLGLSGDRLVAFSDAQSDATRRPWAAKDVPPLAEWLKLNEKPLALALEATKRPEYFNPMVSRRKPGEGSNLIAGLLPTVQKNRELANALTTRAMLRLNEGKLDDAWADLLACHRLGRLLSRGATFIEMLVGVAIGQIANHSSLAFLDHPGLTAKKAAQCLKDLQLVPRPGALAETVRLSERMMGLDALQNIRRAGSGADPFAGALDAELAFPNKKKVFEVIDWTVVMRTMNARYDRLAEVLSIKDRDVRAKAYEKFEAELAAVKKEFVDEAKIKKILDGKDPGPALGKLFADTLMSLLTPAVQKVQQACDRGEQTAANLRLAFALAAYQKDTGRYPAKLTDLAPKYIAAVPDDLFTGKPLVYKPTEKGYLFYSFGVNGKDDDGTTYGEEPLGSDDLPIRMPLPPLKKN